MASKNCDDSAFAVILDRTEQVLVVQKRNGNWGLPGGGLEKGETPREAVLRELREETGLKGKPGAADFVTKVSRPRGRVYLFFLPRKATKGTLCGRTTEIRRQRWIRPKKALKLLTDRNAARLRRVLPTVL